jgi:hypothetical protein
MYNVVTENTLPSTVSEKMNESSGYIIIKRKNYKLCSTIPECPYCLIYTNSDSKLVLNRKCSSNQKSGRDWELY